MKCQKLRLEKLNDRAFQIYFKFDQILNKANKLFFALNFKQKLLIWPNLELILRG